MIKVIIILLLLVFPIASSAQIASGGAFSIEKSVVATGGGTSSSGEFSVTGTSGQNAAGQSMNQSAFIHQNGFWNADNFIPTSAAVSISGKVLTADGRGIRNAQITLTDSVGTTRTVVTSSFGIYRFTEVTVGETYVLTVFSKRFIFAVPHRIVSINEELNNFEFVAEN